MAQKKEKKRKKRKEKEKGRETDISQTIVGFIRSVQWFKSVDQSGAGTC